MTLEEQTPEPRLTEEELHSRFPLIGHAVTLFEVAVDFIKPKQSVDLMYLTNEEIDRLHE